MQTAGGEGTEEGGGAAVTRLEKRPSQTARLVSLLRSRSGQWVPLSEILDMSPRITQFSARIWEARHEMGLEIKNKFEVKDGHKLSWFMLVEHTIRQDMTTATADKVPADSLTQ